MIKYAIPYRNTIVHVDSTLDEHDSTSGIYKWGTRTSQFSVGDAEPRPSTICASVVGPAGMTSPLGAKGGAGSPAYNITTTSSVVFGVVLRKIVFQLKKRTS